MPDNETPAVMSVRQAIAAEVRAEMARQSRSFSDMGTVLGMSRQSMHLRLKGEVPFRVEELILLAAELRVPVEQFMPTTETTPAGTS